MLVLGKVQWLLVDTIGSEAFLGVNYLFLVLEPANFLATVLLRNFHDGILLATLLVNVSLLDSYCLRKSGS